MPRQIRGRDSLSTQPAGIAIVPCLSVLGPQTHTLVDGAELLAVGVVNLLVAVVNVEAGDAAGGVVLVLAAVGQGQQTGGYAVAQGLGAQGDGEVLCVAGAVAAPGGQQEVGQDEEEADADEGGGDEGLGMSVGVLAVVCRMKAMCQVLTPMVEDEDGALLLAMAKVDWVYR